MLPQAGKSPGSPFSILHRSGSGSFHPVVQVLCGHCGWYPDSRGAECSMGTVWALCVHGLHVLSLYILSWGEGRGI